MTMHGTTMAHDGSLELLIDQILNQRQGFAQRIVRKRQLLEQQYLAVTTLLNSMAKARGMKLALIDDQLEHLMASLSDSEKKLRELIDTLSRTEIRFQRDVLSVVVVGASGMGKSTLLQLLSRLTSKEIPSGNAGDCSAVRSAIMHTDGEPHALVSFYSRESFFTRIVLPYFTVVAPDHCPRKLDDFLKQPLPVLNNPSPLHEEYLKRLAIFRDHYPAYGELLTGQRDHRIPVSEVREHVAKYDATNTPCWKYIAVEEVRIYVPFPRHGLRRLALVDMQGLGSVEVGIEKRTIETLREKADAVIFVKKPGTGRALICSEDYALYETVQSGMPDLPLSEWGFLVINHDSTNGDNWQQCLYLRDEFNNSPFRVRQTIVTDCSQPTVADDVLKPILEHLRNHLERFDGNCIQGTMSQIQELQLRLTPLMESIAKTVMQSPASADVNIESGSLFKDTFSQLKADLSKRVLSPSEAEIQSMKNALGKLVTDLKCSSVIPDEASFESAAERDFVAEYYLSRKRAAYEFIDKKVAAFGSLASDVFSSIRDRVREVFEASGKLSEIGLAKGPEWWLLLADEVGADFSRKVLSDRLREFGELNFSNAAILALGFESGIAKLRSDNLLQVPDPVVGINWRAFTAPFRKGLKNFSLDDFFIRRVVSSGEAVARLNAAYADATSEIERKIDKIARDTVCQIESQVRQKVRQLVAEDTEETWRALYLSRNREIWRGEFEIRLAHRDMVIDLRRQSISIRQMAKEHSTELGV